MFFIQQVAIVNAQTIEEHVPEYWGVITVELVDGEFDFYVLRKPSHNPKVTWKRKLEILWRTELAYLQELNNMPKYKDKSKAYVIGKFIELLDKSKLNEEILKKQVSDCLYERDYNTIAEELREYHKGEIAKELENENDPQKRLELIMKREMARANLKGKTRKRRRR